MVTDKEYRWCSIAVYLVFSVFYFWLASQIPYMHDDWDWGLGGGIYQWINATINSRYVGNFFEVFMTRSEIIKTLSLGTCFFLIPYLISKICSINRDEEKLQLLLFVFANFLLLMMNRRLWRETYGWVAGFANFGISAVFMLLCLFQWIPLILEKVQDSEFSISGNIFFFFICMAGQLFIENLSIFMAAFSVLMCFIAYKRTKRIPLRFVLMALGTIIGLAIMFSSTIYSSLLSTGEAVNGYRKLILTSGDSLQEKLIRLIKQGSRLIVKMGELNPGINIAILLLLMVKIHSSKRNVKKYAFRFLAVNCVLVAYYFYRLYNETELSFNSILAATCRAAINVLYFVMVSIEVLHTYRDATNIKRILLIIWGTSLGVILPLVATREVGDRLFLTPYILFVLFIAFMVQEILEGCGGKVNRAAFCLCAVGALVTIIMYAEIYNDIGKCKALRAEIIEDAAITGTKTLVLPKFPYEEYLYFTEPNTEDRWVYFKEFYGIASNAEIIID